MSSATLGGVTYPTAMPVTEQVPEGDVVIEPGTEVSATDGKVGTVKDVLVDDSSGKINGFVTGGTCLILLSMSVWNNSRSDDSG